MYYTDTALPTSAGAKIIVWLSGGSGCYDNTTCSQRYDEDPSYETAPNSTNFTADTVFLNSSYFNQAFYDYVHVLVPYCSSDFWQGTQEASSYTNDWHFYGLRSRHPLCSPGGPASYLLRSPLRTAVIVGAPTAIGGVWIAVDVESTTVAHNRRLGSP